MEHQCPYCLQTFEEKGKGILSSHQCGSIVSQITADLSASMGAGRDTIILQAIRDTDRTNSVISKALIDRCAANAPKFATAVRDRGRFEIYPDKTETFFWDDKPLIHFMPMEIKHEGGKITASQPYQVLRVPHSVEEGCKK